MNIRSRIIAGIFINVLIFVILSFVIFATSAEGLAAQKASIYLILSIAAFINILIGYWIHYAILRPIYELARAGKELVDGKAKKIISLTQYDEFKILKDLFNNLAEKIDTTQKSVSDIDVQKEKEFERLKQTLEERVAQQTKELEEKIQALEKFQQLTIDRELKMIELKKRIAELESKSSSQNVAEK